MTNSDRTFLSVFCVLTLPKRGVCVRSKRVRDGAAASRAAHGSRSRAGSKDVRGVLSTLGHSSCGKGDRKGRACSDLAVHRDGSMVLHDLGRDVEPHAQTRDRSLLGISGPIEALKNLVAQFSGDAQAMIAHPDRDRLCGGGKIHLDGLGLGRILDSRASEPKKM